MSEQLPDTIEITRAEYERLLALIAGDGPSKSIADFCEAENVSKAMYFKMREAGLGPIEYCIGDLVRITPQAIRDWRAKRVAATAQGARRGRRNSQREVSTAAAI
jgi:hypothetical protein